MDGPTIIAGLSVVIAGVTSLGAPIIAGRNQRKGDEARFAFDLRRAERDELRTLLDEAAVSAFELAHSAEKLDSAFTRGLQTADALRQEVTEHRKTIGYLHARMHVRIGRAPASLKLDDFITEVGKSLSLIDSIHNSGEPREQLLDTAVLRNMLAWAAYWDYIEEAGKLAGMTTVQGRDDRAQALPPVPESPEIGGNPAQSEPSAKDPKRPE